MLTYGCVVQLDLCDSKVLRLARARSAVRDFDLPAAVREYEAYLTDYPGEATAESELASVRRVAQRLAELERQADDPVAALVLLQDHVDDVMLPGWHRRLAAEAERHRGSGCMVDSNPAGLHWHLGGDLDQAERSLRDSLRQSAEDAQTRVYLANALLDRGDISRARQEYLRAFLTDPAAIAVDTVADGDVAALSDVAKTEYEVVGEPPGWVAAVGTVEGTFTLPIGTLPGIELSVPADSAGLTFYRSMLEERGAQSHDERVRIRADMKTLCPMLLAAYLQRFR